MQRSMGATLLLAVMSRGVPAAGTDELRFNDDGSIAAWSICRGESPPCLVMVDRPTLKLRLVADGIGSRASAEVRRTHRVVAGGGLQEVISLANVSSVPTSRIRLVLSAVEPPPIRNATGQWLADQVYGFSRSYLATEGGDWQVAESGLRTRAFASTARHRVAVIDASEQFTLRRGDRLETTPAEAEPADGWLLEFDVPGLDPGAVHAIRLSISAVPAAIDRLASAGQGSLAYADLWSPLALLCRWIERALIQLSAHVGGAGIAVMLLAILVRLAMAPITVWSARRQANFASVTAKIKPDIAEVRKHYKGAEQSELILKVYHDHGLSPLSGLAGSAGLFVQIPFLLAVFNVTTQSSFFSGADLLWITDLSLPDAVAALPVAIPLLGDQLHLLPLLLGALLVLSPGSVTQQSGASRVIPTIVTVLIVLVFYAFAAAVVLYWVTTTLVQVVERAIIPHWAAQV